LWERTPSHPDALTVRLGSTTRGGVHGEQPVTVDLREAGALGLAGPRARLAALTRSVLAQLAALHGPSTLEMVLLCTDRARGAELRAAEWSWLGWLPHLRPAHGQDCTLLVAYDREQATARTAELLRRLDSRGSPAPTGRPGRTASGTAAPDASDGPDPGAPGSSTGSSTVSRPTESPDVSGAPSTPAGTGTPEGSDSPEAPQAPQAPQATEAPGAPAAPSPVTVVIVDGDPGSAALRERVTRLAREGPAAGIHLLCLAETPPASPASPVTATIEAANTACAAFLECGTLALLSGDVATAVRLVHRTAPAAAPAAGPAATLDGVSAAWAERFARALAPLREPEGAADGAGPRPAVTLPRSCRLLDELGLARATPAALLARWSERGGEAAGRVSAVFGAGPHGTLEADLAQLRGHVLVSGGPGTGKSELLHSLAASLAAGERPDRLALLLVDGAGAEAGDGLRACAELPHVTGHLTAGDPVRMRDFAQALAAELKRRAELIGEERTYEEYARVTSRPGGRVVSPRSSPAEERERGRAQARAGRPAGQPVLQTGGAAGGSADAPSPPDSAQGAAPAAPAPPAPPPPAPSVPTAPAVPAAPSAPSGRSQEPRPAVGGASDVTEPDTTRRTLRLRPQREPRDAQEAVDAAEGPGRAGGPDGTGGTEGPADRSGSPGSSTSRPYGLGGGSASPAASGAAGPLTRLAVLVDDFDTLVDPALGNPGRPAAGSVVRALEAIAREGARLGVHLIAATGRADRTSGTAVSRLAALHAELTGSEAREGSGGPDGLPVGRGTLTAASGGSTGFQAGRVTGRIPRTATVRPTVVPLDWTRTGDPPARRPVKELGNGPTDLALLASALGRAAQQSVRRT
ncbi:FtsK/SpoIIIE domain-containing protein, partial [Streptomyces boncukensis]